MRVALTVIFTGVLITFLFIGCELDVIIVPSPAFDDHGSGVDTATPVTAGSSTVGMIDTANDNDYFSIDIEDGQRIRVRTTGPTNTIGALLASDGEQLKILGDNRGDLEDKNFDDIYDVTQESTYYIRVASEGDSTGGYTLFVDVEPTPES